MADVGERKRKARDEGEETNNNEKDKSERHRDKRRSGGGREEDRHGKERSKREDDRRERSSRRDSDRDRDRGRDRDREKERGRGKERERDRVRDRDRGRKTEEKVTDREETSRKDKSVEEQKEATEDTPTKQIKSEVASKENGDTEETSEERKPEETPEEDAKDKDSVEDVAEASAKDKEPRSLDDKDKDKDKDKERDRDRDRHRESGSSRHRRHSSSSSTRSSSSSSRRRHRSRSRSSSPRRSRSPHSRSDKHISSSSGRKRRSPSSDKEERKKKEKASTPSSPSSSSSDGSDNEKPSKKKRRRQSGWDNAPTALTTIPTAVPLLTTPPLATPLLPMTDLDKFKLQQQSLVLQQQQQALQVQQVMLEQQQQALAIKNATASTNQALACRIYVGSIHFDLGEADIRAAFSPFGPIKNINISRDPLTGRSKGFCFIEYAYPDAANAALKHMNGFTLASSTNPSICSVIKVGRPHNAGVGLLPTVGIPGIPTIGTPLVPLPTATATPLVTALPTVPSLIPQPILAKAPVEDTSNRIYVGSIHWDLTAEDIKTVFEAFGPIKSCVLMPNPETGKHKGYGFIEYESAKSAEEAMGQMNGWELGGRQIKVGRAITSTPSPTLPIALPTAIPTLNPALAAPVLSTPIPGLTGATPFNPSLVAGNLAQVLAQKKAEDSLSAEENITISNPNKRFEIMQKLARAPDLKMSRCIVLKNMVGPEDVDEELETEVTEECSKFGTVEMVVIYQERQSEKEDDVIVKIFICFKTHADAQKAISNLDGRFFGGRQIKAEYIDEVKFLAEQYKDL